MQIRNSNLAWHLIRWSRLNEKTGCYEWIGPTVKGYGNVGFHGKTKRAHRTSYEEFIGPIPKGLLVCHQCDNPPCINPDHLFLGTPLDNMRDKIKKGRARYKKLNIPKGRIDLIHRLLAQDISRTRTAEIVGISAMTLRHWIRRGFIKAPPSKTKNGKVHMKRKFKISENKNGNT